jgi:hypothetical protein
MIAVDVEDVPNPRFGRSALIHSGGVLLFKR